MGKRDRTLSLSGTPLATVVGALAAVAVVAFAGSGLAFAQSSRSQPLPYLLDVGDLRALVRYSPGALDRATHVQVRFALLAQDFAKWSGEAVPISVVLLSRTDWEALDLAVPYGLPARLSNGEIALSAWGDGSTVALWRSLLDGDLPVLEGNPLQGSRAEASSLLLTDLLAQGVAARALLERAGFSGAHPEVVNFVAHVVGLAASHRHEPLSLAELDLVYSVAPEPLPGAQPSWRSRLAREGTHYRAAQALVAKRGAAKAAKAVLKMLRTKPASLTPGLIADRFPEVRGLLPGS